MRGGVRLRCHVGDEQGLGQSDGREQRQEQPCPLLKIAFRVMPEPVVPHFMKTLRQDVHQEAAEELDAGQSAQLPLARVPLLVIDMAFCVAEPTR